MKIGKTEQPRFLTYSEPGHGHANEDAILILPLPDDDNTLLCTLADGQGGQSGGAEAAQIAVRESLKIAATFSPSMLLKEHTWLGILGAADEVVEAAPSAGYTTLVCLCVSDGRLCGASSGDSAALLLNDDQEHLLTECQLKNPPVGSSAARPVAFSARLGRAWKLLIMSDGVWKYVGWETIGQNIRRHEGQKLIASLRQAVAETSDGKLPDDFSIVLLQSDKVPDPEQLMTQKP